MMEERIRNAVLEIRDQAASEGIDAAFSVHRERSHLMRIGNNSVSLSTSETLTRLDIEVTVGRRQGSHTRLGRISGASDVRTVLDTAVANASHAMPKDYQPPLHVVEEPIDERDQHDEALARLDPAVKASAYGAIIKQVGERYNYSGSWSSGEMEQYVTSTANGNEAFHTGTDQQFSMVLKHPEQRWELRHTQTGWRAHDFDAHATVEYFRSLLPLYQGQPGYQVEAGEYAVVFGAEAVADILAMSLWTGLNGRSWEEKLGWTSHKKPGDSILGSNINVADDPLNDQTFRFGFDLHGKRRRHFALVDEGKLVQLMYDANTAAKYGRTATGHNVASLSAVMSPGGGPSDVLDAVGDIERALYVPALHYVHVPNRSEGIFTGSSRFNAVLVENGRMKRPIFSSRVTDSFSNVLGKVTTLSSESVSVNTSNTYGRRYPEAMSVPTYAVVDGVKITDSADSF